MTLKIEVVREDRIVVISGERYQYTISKGNGANWTDITHLKDWAPLATHVATLVLETSHKQKIDTADLVLQGDFSDLETQAPLKEKTITFVSAKVNVDGKDQAVRDLNILPQALQQKVRDKISQIGKDFALIKPLSAVPTTSTCTTVTPPTTTVLPTLTVDATGRCLDKALAYLLLKQHNQSHPGTDELNRIADDLRTQAAQIIKTDSSLDRDEKFFPCLRNSLLNIPAFSHETRYSLLDKQASQRSVTTNLLGNDPARCEEIKTILNIDAYINTTVEQRKKLRDLYADYIVNGIKDNYLDLAFLYTLPKINIPPYSTHGLHCAVLRPIRGNYLIEAKYPTNAELKVSNEWLFVHYNGDNHYDAVDMTNESAKAIINNLIKDDQKRVYDELIALISNDITSGYEIRRRLTQELRLQYPSLYKLFAKAAYDYDLAVWNLSDKGLPEPGTTPITAGSRTYLDSQYGDYVIDTTVPEDLKRRLRTSIGLNLLPQQLSL